MAIYLVPTLPPGSSGTPTRIARSAMRKKHKAQNYKSQTKHKTQFLNTLTKIPRIFAVWVLCLCNLCLFHITLRVMRVGSALHPGKDLAVSLPTLPPGSPFITCKVIKGPWSSRTTRKVGPPAPWRCRGVINPTWFMASLFAPLPATSHGV